MRAIGQGGGRGPGSCGDPSDVSERLSSPSWGSAGVAGLFPAVDEVCGTFLGRGTCTCSAVGAANRRSPSAVVLDESLLFWV